MVCNRTNNLLKTLINFNTDTVASRCHCSRSRGTRPQKWIEYHIPFHRIHIDQSICQIIRKCGTPQSRQCLWKFLFYSLDIRPHIRIPDIPLFPKEGTFAPVLFLVLCCQRYPQPKGWGLCFLAVSVLPEG